MLPIFFRPGKLGFELSGGVPPLNSQVMSFSTQIYLRNWVW